MKKVLVICIGNSCRSQMAEGYLRFYGRGKADYASAGLYPSTVHPLAVQVMMEDNIDISMHTSEIIESFRDQFFDYVLVMCDEITTQLPTYLSTGQKLEYCVPDPAAFVGSEEDTLNEFRRVREMIKTKILKFIGQELIEKKEMVDTE